MRTTHFFVRNACFYLRLPAEQVAPRREVRRQQPKQRVSQYSTMPLARMRR